MFDGFKYCHLWKVQFQLIGIFLDFFVWSVNCTNLYRKLWILFCTFTDMWAVLKYYRIFGTVLHRNQFQLVANFLATFCWSIDWLSWMSLFFRYLQKLKHYLYLRPFNLFSFIESSVLTIKYVFSFCLVFKWYKSSLQIIHLN